MPLCHCCSCGDSNPLRDVFAIQRGVTAATAADVEATEPEEKLEYWKNGDVTVLYDREAGTQIIQHQESLTDYCSVSSEGSDWSSIAGLGSPLSPSSCSLPAEPPDTGRSPSPKAPALQDPDPDSGGAEMPPCAQLQAFSVLWVNRTLWIPR